MRNALLASGFAALLAAAPATAQTGAPMAAATQPGAWGANGWQPGAAPAPYAAAPAPTATAPAYQQPAYQPAPYQSAVPDKVYDRIERGRKVKGPALANTVADPQDWGLPYPGPSMRWIRYYDDAVLLDAKDRAVDVRSVPWDTLHQTPVQRPGFAGGYPAPMPMRAPGTYTERHGNTVTTTQILPPPAIPGSYGPYGQVVSVVPGTITTTTTTSWRTVRRGPSRWRHRARTRSYRGS